MNNKTKVLSVQLGKTLSFVKFVVEFIDLKEAYIPNLGLLLCLEPFKKFLVVGGGWVV